MSSSSPMYYIDIRHGRSFHRSFIFLLRLTVRRYIPFSNVLLLPRSLSLDEFFGITTQQQQKQRRQRQQYSVPFARCVFNMYFLLSPLYFILFSFFIVFVYCVWCLLTFMCSPFSGFLSNSLVSLFHLHSQTHTHTFLCSLFCKCWQLYFLYHSLWLRVWPYNSHTHTHSRTRTHKYKHQLTDIRVHIEFCDKIATAHTHTEENIRRYSPSSLLLCTNLLKKLLHAISTAGKLLEM